MSDRYPGGLIRKTPPTITPPVNGEGGSAPGIWTLEQVAYYTKEGEWPKPIIPRNLYAWGWNSYSGQLGDNTLISRSSPVQIGSETTWLELATGQYFANATKTDGTLWSWGYGQGGRSGHNDQINRSSPTQIGALTTWADTFAGQENGYGLKSDGTLWAWGAEEGVPDNAMVGRSSPVQIGSDTDWLYVDGFNQFAVSVKTDGTMWSWGTGLYGRLGNNSTINCSSPVQIGSLSTWAKIAAGYQNTLALKTDGTLWAWGRDNHGQLGINEYNVGRSSPVQVGALTTWLEVSASTGGYSSMAIKNDGTLWVWGRNNHGQLGIDSVVSRSSPVQLGSDTNWSSAIMGTFYSNAIKTDGTWWSLGGQNNRGSLGLGDLVYRSSPVQLGSETTWTKGVAHKSTYAIG